MNIGTDGVLVRFVSDLLVPVPFIHSPRLATRHSWYCLVGNNADMGPGYRLA